MTTAVQRRPSRAGRSLSPRRRAANLGAAVLIGLGTLIVVAPLILIFAYLISQGLGALNMHFFTRTPAPEGEAGGGWLNAIVGSVIILLVATLVGVLVGVAGGLFLSEFPRHRLMPTIRMVSDVMAGIPAIVVGLVVYALVVLHFGFSGLAGGLALGLLMIPIVVRTTEEVMKLVPLSVREAGLALGLPQWRVILSIVLPAARGGIITGVMLAVARVAGEAAPLLFTAFGSNLLELNPARPMSALPLQIYLGATSAFDENQRLAKAGALLLILLIFATSLTARLVSRRR